MAGKQDPLILALARIGRELRKTIDSVPTAKGKDMAMQLARDTLDDIDREREEHAKELTAGVLVKAAGWTEQHVGNGAKA